MTKALELVRELSSRIELILGERDAALARNHLQLADNMDATLAIIANDLRAALHYLDGGHNAIMD